MPYMTLFVGSKESEGRVGNRWRDSEDAELFMWNHLQIHKCEYYY